MPKMIIKKCTLATALAMVSLLVQAQSVYRIVAPDGTVTFSDRPPPTGSAPLTKSSTLSASGGIAAGINNPTLPYTLRLVTGKYPVVLYTGTTCSPCDAGRSLLTARGIPFSERSVTTREDAEALKRLTGDDSLPYLAIGKQKIKGFSDNEWIQYLDAAGYPAKSMLPTGYKNPPASALVPVKKREEAPQPEAIQPIEPNPSPAVEEVPPTDPDKPRGFVF